MRMVWPVARDVDPVATYGDDERHGSPDRPWVLANMIASADGSAADADGLSGGLGGPADAAVFSAIRGVADVVVAGAATVVAEDYGPARPPAAVRERRQARGQAPAPRIAVLSARLSIDPGRRLFREAPSDRRPIVLTVAGADAARRRALEAVAEVHTVGESASETDTEVCWRGALDALRAATGASVVLCEGGPRTIGQLVADDLLDELCLTVAPALVGGSGPRIAEGSPPTGERPLSLDRVLVADDHLFLRYLRQRRFT
jgi:riboflavin biosynthesis pyrimidine reductase